jgi:hypothetical protein
MMIPIPIATFQAAPLAGVCTNLCAFLASPYTSWLSLVIAVILAIIFILAIIYQLSPLLGRNDLRNWVRIKIFDELLSLVYVFLFAIFGTAVFAIQPTGALNSVGLVPNNCLMQVAANPSTPGSLTNYDSIFFLSVCDVGDFNNDINAFAEGVFIVSFVVAISPTTAWQYPPGPLTLSLGEEDEQLYNFSDIGISTRVDWLPIQPVFFYVVPLLNSLYVLMVFSQVQTLLIAAAPLIFGILMAVGIIARAFGITRTFGNAMIAFAFGIGIIYPVMTMISYGFLDRALDAAGTALYTNLGIGGTGTFGWVTDTLNVLTSAIFPITLFTAIQSFLVEGGLVAMGLTFIPLFNLTVVDVFIVDFSRSMGERMDFLSLLTRIL